MLLGGHCLQMADFSHSSTDLRCSSGRRPTDPFRFSLIPHKAMSAPWLDGKQMSVLVEAITVVVRNDAVDRCVPGGVSALAVN